MLAQNYTLPVGVGIPHCRRPIVPACDPAALNVGTNPTLVNTSPLILELGDIIDVGLDWSAWLASNGGKILSSVWAAHASSPAVPPLVVPAALFDEAGCYTVALLDLSAATVGATYWLTNTIVVKTDPIGSFAMPDRTVNRNIWLRVSR